MIKELKSIIEVHASFVEEWTEDEWKTHFKNIKELNIIDESKLEIIFRDGGVLNLILRVKEKPKKLDLTNFGAYLSKS